MVAIVEKCGNAVLRIALNKRLALIQTLLLTLLVSSGSLYRNVKVLPLAVLVCSFKCQIIVHEPNLVRDFAHLSKSKSN